MAFELVDLGQQGTKMKIIFVRHGEPDYSMLDKLENPQLYSGCLLYTSKYVNEKGNVELSRDEVLGKSGDAINYSTATKISSYKRQGYELVSDGFTSASNKNFDFDTAFDQEFTVVLRERIEPIDPDKPTPTPDKPVDPNDPDTPKWLSLIHIWCQYRYV